MKRIEKKCWPTYFEQVESGEKTIDIRLNDEDMQEGDILVLKEWDPVEQQYTGREQQKGISHVMKTKDMVYWSEEDMGKYGFVILSLK